MKCDCMFFLSKEHAIRLRRQRQLNSERNADKQKSRSRSGTPVLIHLHCRGGQRRAVGATDEPALRGREGDDAAEGHFGEPRRPEEALYGAPPGEALAKHGVPGLGVLGFQGSAAGGGEVGGLQHFGVQDDAAEQLGSADGHAHAIPAKRGDEAGSIAAHHYVAFYLALGGEGDFVDHFGLREDEVAVLENAL